MSSQQQMIRVTIYRGGTSKGLYLLENDLPYNQAERDRTILAIFGSPDPRQIDGLGGADSLTSKVAIINRSSHPEADVDYTFGQVSLTSPLVDYRGNCGNISSGVGPFAVDMGLVRALEPVTTVRIFNTNTKKLIVADVPVIGGRASILGDCAIPGVPGTGARIVVDFPDCGGAVTGRILPTGREKEDLRLGDGRSLEVSIVDAANPCVFARGEDLGIHEPLTPQQINANTDLLKTLEEIRSRAGERIGLVSDWRTATECSPAVPKMILISATSGYKAIGGEQVLAGDMDLVGRAMSMQKAHKAFPVTGSICTGIAANIKGTLVHEIVYQDTLPKVRIGHPSGVIRVQARLERSDDGIRVRQAAVDRTARRILCGHVFVPKERVQ